MDTENHRELLAGSSAVSFSSVALGIPAILTPVRCIFDKCTQMCNHHQNQDTEYFHHHTKSPCSRGWFHGCASSAVPGALELSRAPHLLDHAAAAALKFLLFEQGAPCFHFALGPENYVACATSTPFHHSNPRQPLTCFAAVG